jgi:D-alanyl-D-alanine dipeptidase
MPKHDDDARRAYWVAQMEEAYRFMVAVGDYPVAECGERAVSLRDAADAAGVEVEFSSKPHVNGGPRLFLLRDGLIPDFVACARAMNDRGWVLKVEDGFRTRPMQKLLALQEATFDAILRRVTWECGGKCPTADLMLRRTGVLVALRPMNGTHMSASAMDISVLDRDGRGEVDRGGPYLEMSERTPMASPFVSEEARENRRAITELMGARGLVAYPWEFWHYSKGDAFDGLLNRTGRPARYGPVDVDLPDGSVAPMANPTAPLNTREDIQREIARALSRAERRT